MNRLAILALTLAVAGCDSGKKDGAAATESKRPAPPDPAGKWEQRSATEGPYLFTRYEFKDDHSFTRETGSSTAGVTQKINGSWSASGQEAPYYSTGKSLKEHMLRGAGLQTDTGKPMGSLVLRYSVKSKSDIQVGATLVAQRGPIMEPDKQTFDIEEHLSLLRTKTDDKEWLIVGLQRFAKVTP